MRLSTWRSLERIDGAASTAHVQASGVTFGTYHGMSSPCPFSQLSIQTQDVHKHLMLPRVITGHSCRLYKTPEQVLRNNTSDGHLLVLHIPLATITNIYPQSLAPKNRNDYSYTQYEPIAEPVGVDCSGVQLHRTRPAYDSRQW